MPTLQVTESKSGYAWTTYMVQGWREADGRHGRKRFKSREEAEAFIATKNVELANSDTALHTGLRRLVIGPEERQCNALSTAAARPIAHLNLTPGVSLEGVTPAIADLPGGPDFGPRVLPLGIGLNLPRQLPRQISAHFRAFQVPFDPHCPKTKTARKLLSASRLNWLRG